MRARHRIRCSRWRPRSRTGSRSSHLRRECAACRVPAPWRFATWTCLHIRSRSLATQRELQRRISFVGGSFRVVNAMPSAVGKFLMSMLAARLVQIACVVVTLAVGRTAYAEQRYALVIGANPGWSSDRPLRYAETDAERMRDVLIALGGFAPDRVELL